MREIVHIQAGQCGNQIGAKVRCFFCSKLLYSFQSFFCEKLKLPQKQRKRRGQNVWKKCKIRENLA